jgi:hypothetical protein
VDNGQSEQAERDARALRCARARTDNEALRRATPTKAIPRYSRRVNGPRSTRAAAPYLRRVRRMTPSANAEQTVVTD